MRNIDFGRSWLLTPKANTEDLWGQLYEALFSTILPTISGREVQLLEINLPGLGLKLLENFEIFDDVSVYFL